MSDQPRPFHLEPAAAPEGTPLLSDDAPNHYWVLSNGRGWSLVLGQNIGKVPPEIRASPSGTLFVGLYHGTVASVNPEDGRVIAQAKLAPGNLVFWSEHGDLMVAEGELEVGVFDAGGRFLWKAGTGGVIELVESSGDTLTLTDSEERSSSFDARTGKLR